MGIRRRVARVLHWLLSQVEHEPRGSDHFAGEWEMRTYTKDGLTLHGPAGTWDEGRLFLFGWVRTK